MFRGFPVRLEVACVQHGSIERHFRVRQPYQSALSMKDTRQAPKGKERQLFFAYYQPDNGHDDQERKHG